MRLREHGWQQCWCAPGTGEALGVPGGPRLLRGQGRQRVCNTQDMDGGVPGGNLPESKAPLCWVGIGAFRACLLPPVWSLVGRKHTVG